jgi:hypothetical protein
MAFWRAAFHDGGPGAAAAAEKAAVSELVLVSLGGGERVIRMYACMYMYI